VCVSLFKKEATGVPLHGTKYAAQLCYKLYLNIGFTALIYYKFVNKLLHLKYLSAPICAFHMYSVGYEVYHHPHFY
jgi:hypothetical protein